MPNNQQILVVLGIVAIILPTVASHISSYLVNQLSPLPSFPNKDWWIIGALGLLTALVVGIILWQARRQGDGQSSSTAPDKLLDTREKLLRRLQRDVRLRVETSLHQLTKIDLQMEDRRQQVGQFCPPLVPEDLPEQAHENIFNRIFRFFKKNASKAQLPPTQRIIEIFNRSDIERRLLILGEPGAGKTTELLTLAQDLLQQATADKEQPIPVIFELSAWREDKPIAQWLVERLTTVYKLSPAIGQQWLDGQQILPLLDGLDELGLERQKKCIEFINEFLAEQNQPHCVVCCRREEYEQGQIKLDQMNGAVYLCSLRDEQIQGYFRQLKRSWLWGNVRQNPELLKLARSPLFLAMLVYAYQDRAIQNSQELFETYIVRRLNDPQSQGIYPPGKAPTPEQTRHYVSWLAQKLEAIGEKDFLIEAMQPEWLASARQRGFYKAVVGLIVGLIVGLSGGLIYELIFGLIFGLSTEPIFELIVRLSAEPIFVLISGLLGAVFYRDGIATVEQLSWSWKQPWDRLLLGLFLGASVELILGRSFGLIFGLIFGLSGGVSSIAVEDKSTPNQGIRRSAVNAVIFGLIFGLSGGLIFGLIFGLSGGLIFGLSLGLNGGLFYGGAAVIQYFVLRLILYHNGFIPCRYDRFLDHAVKHRFIQRVGGRYRFMHDLLRKHFAATEGNP